MKTKNTPPENDKSAIFLSLLEQGKALDPVLIKLDNSIADSLLIATATSRRHAQGLADAISEHCHANKLDFFGMEGYNVGDWILLDCNDLLINIFLEDSRKLYRLEELWSKYHTGEHE